MNLFQRPTRIQLSELLATSEPEPEVQLGRIRFMERNIGLPVKAVVIGFLLYILFFSSWFEDVTNVVGTAPTVKSPRTAVQRSFLTNKAEITLFPTVQVALEVVQRFFLIYVVINIGVASLLLGMSQFRLKFIRRVVFFISLVDALFLASLTMLTGGFHSYLFWVFLGLIIRNAISMPAMSLQLILNFLVNVCYATGGILYIRISKLDEDVIDPDILAAIQSPATETSAEHYLVPQFLLILMTACCYGVHALVEKQRQAEEEAREFALRQEQLRSAGRLAAEIAHQIKNPLGIINNAAFTLQRTLKEGKTITQQIQIIREEVARSDKILTELMGYAQLAEGKVERVNVTEEVDHAISEVFPPAAKYETRVHRHYAPALPPLLIQRIHLSEIFTNILQNAREALQGRGNIHVSANFAENYSVMVTLADDGPGIAEELRERIFEAYFTTKPKGTGLGLAIVKHNIEMYGGNVKVESELGKGTRFVLLFPARTTMKLRK
jgi:signal transduction histidine kinase